VSYDFEIERLIDAPPDVVFDSIVNPDVQEELFTGVVEGWGRSVEFMETLTFEEQDGKTLLTVVESGFETEADRDGFLSGVPTWADAVAELAERRAREGR
jgi:uncharacterized protein YndB with AHSA1/START domain